MLKIKDLFALDVEKEVNLVIKADDQTPTQVEKDISEYIVTDQIENLLETFLESYTLSSTDKIGTWISGFFGSGKSYFAKILGYLIENTKLQNGLTAHDRFRERLNSSDKKDFIDGQISAIEKINAEVVIFEIIEHSSSNEDDKIQKIMLKKLFEKLGYSKDLNLSSMEFELQNQGYYDEFKDYLTQNNFDIETERDNQTIFGKHAIDYLVKRQKFSNENANDFLKSALQKYSSNLTPSTFTDICLKISQEKKERIVFVIDEMGAYVTSQKGSDERLLQLQAISESFASNGRGMLWIIATSQEKLDEIAQIAERKGAFSKITDRFSVKLDLTSENVDEVVRRKMLAKRTDIIGDLEELFDSKKGNIQTITDTKGEYPKTDSFDGFKDYYPFFEYQIKMLPDLIESPTGTVYAEANERKLISIVDMILKKLKDNDYTRCTNIVDIFDSLGVKFFGSGRIEHLNKLDKQSKEIFLDDPIKPSDVMKALETIKRIGKRMNSNEEVLTRVLISDLNQNTYQMQKYVHKCVDFLEKNQQITVHEGIIEIVSDIEKEFITFRENQIVSMPEIKKKIAEKLESMLTLNFTYKNGPSIPIGWSYNGDRKWGKSNGILIKILPFESNDSIERRIEGIEFESTNNKETVYVIPNSSNIEDKITKLIKLEKALDEFRASKNSSEFNNTRTKYEKIKEEESKELEREMRSSLGKGTIVYYYDKKDIDGKLEDSIKEIIESKVVKNYYPNIISEKAKMDDVKKVLTEPKNKLFLIRQDEEHIVFDKDGELIEHHKLIDPIANFLNAKRNGADVLDNFEKAPYGWTQETIMYAIAAMLRGGKIEVNNNDDYGDPQTISTLMTSTKLKNATLSLNASIPVEKKEVILKLFNELSGDSKLDIGDPNSKFFRIGEEAIKKLVGNVRYVKEKIRSFGASEKYDIDWLSAITLKLDSQDLEAMDIIFAKNDEISKLNSKIIEEKNFLDKNLSRLKEKKDFVNQIDDEIEKASPPNKEKIKSYTQEFRNIIPNFLEYKDRLDEIFEKVRNEYKIIFKSSHGEKEKIFKEFKELLEGASQKKNSLGETAGEQKWFSDYEHEIRNSCSGLEIDHSPKCENCKLGLYETQLLISKVKNDLKEFNEKLDEFMKNVPAIPPKSPDEKPKIIKLKKKMTYGELKREVSNLSTEDGTFVEIELEE